MRTNQVQKLTGRCYEAAPLAQFRPAVGVFMPSDPREFHGSVGKPTYEEAMKGHPPHLIMTLETKDPIEVGDFVGAFTSLANQYEKYVTAEFPGHEGDANVYVAEVKEGSIVAILIEYGGYALAGTGGLVLLDDFVERLGNRIRQYTKSGGRDLEATKSDLRDFHNALAAVAHDPDGSVRLEAAVFEDGERKIRVAFKFKTSEARHAEREIENHKTELEGKASDPQRRVLMTFVRSDIRTTETGKRSGELVLIETISKKPRPLIYASELAEERIKFEIRDEESIYKKGFVVDVYVETRNDKPVAYRVTDVHQVIELPDD
jgi:hypothetical protein